MKYLKAISLSVLLASPSLAQDKEPKAAEVASEDIRTRRQGHALIGAGFLPNAAAGITVGLLSSPIDSVEIGYEQARDNITKTKSVYFQYRRFFGNSFNLLNGLKYDANRYEDNEVVVYYDFESSPGTEKRITPKATQAVLSYQLRIGNMWHWDAFVFGIDWVGIHIPLYNKAPDRLVNSTFKRTYDDVENSIDDAKLSKAVLFNTFIGFSF